MIAPLNIVLNITKVTETLGTAKLPNNLMFPNIDLIVLSNGNFTLNMN
jgi:hypothetical protein